MSIVPIKAKQATLDVEVIQEGDWYTAVCEDLHLVTEAQSFEELTERAWELVPDLIELNNLNIDPDSVQLRFEIVLQSAQSQRIAN